MPSLSTIAAQAWATARAPGSHDPVQFGRDVALVARSCELTEQYSNDSVAISAALALLSVRPEELQGLTQFFELASRLSGSSRQTNEAGEKS